MSDGGLIEQDRGDGVRVVALDRAPANALTAGFLLSIAERFDELAEDASARAVVLTGREGVLSAGMDLKRLPQLDRAGQDAAIHALNRCYGGLYGFPKPLIAAVNGHAVAGGLFFALVADWRIGAAGGARFGLSEVKVGAPFPIGALEIARAELDSATFRRMLLGGGLVGVEEALAAGVLDEIVAGPELEARAVAAARERAASPPDAYARIKRQMRAGVLDRVARAVTDLDEPQLGGWLDPQTPEAIKRVLAR